MRLLRVPRCLLPSVKLGERSRLPAIPAIYYVMWFHRILYIGLSKNIKTRWNSISRPHHKLATFTGRPFVRIHWMPVAERDLENTEAVEIDKYDPPYNIRIERVKGGLRWTIIQLKDFCKDSLAIGILAFIFTVIIRLIWDYVTATPQ